MNAVQKLSSSNPYSQSATGSDYHLSGWQNFLRTLGFRTGYDAWRENMGVQSKEYDAALAQKAYDEEYNLPVNQVARMRAAGINPDLDGGKGIDSGVSSPMGEDPSTPMQSTGDEQQIMSFANGVMSVFTTGLGIVQSFQGITRNRIQNLILGTQAESDFSDFSDKWAFRFLPNKPDSLVDENGLESSWHDLALQRAQIFARKSLPKKMQQKFLDNVKAYWNGAPGDQAAYDEWSKVQEKRFGYGMSRGTYGDLTEDDVLYGITSRLGKLAQRALNATSEDQAVSAENQLEYDKTIDSAVAAEAQNSSNSATKETNDVNAMLRGTMSDILSFLQDAAKGKGIGAGLANVALALMSMQSLQMLPSLSSFSRSSSVGPKGSSVSSSFSF